ncbi:MAG: recombinase family protein [Saprospiraceae bacterium]|nr:recombinase family protein [Saprospiraceae bacterium]
MSKKIGYARVSTNQQELNLQIDALLKEGCDRSLILTDQVSGAKASRYT